MSLTSDKDTHSHTHTHADIRRLYVKWATWSSWQDSQCEELLG